MPDQDRPQPQGALAQIQDDPASRKKFLRMAGTGAASSLAIFIAACGSDKKKSTTAASTAAATTTTATDDTAGDLAIVQYALTLEYLETIFYKEVVASNLFKGANQDLIKHFGASEQEHVNALRAAVKQLGGTPVAKPKTNFPIKDATSVLKLAATVENLGAAAYLGQAGNIKSPEILAAALSIHSVEARHASALNTLLGKSATPDGAFAKPADMQTVLAAVKPFIVA
jgi:rubrerythrin